MEYTTVEHAFQAAKTVSDVERLCVRSQPSPGRAKKAGRQVTLRPDWESVKVGVMRDLLVQKFADSRLRALLLATGDAKLIEGNYWHDNFWGVDFRTPSKGQNHLGKLLMEIREELK